MEAIAQLAQLATFSIRVEKESTGSLPIQGQFAHPGTVSG